MRLATTLPVLAVVALAAASGCGQDDIPAQLERLTVSATSGAGAASAGGQLEASGPLAVTGAGRDLHLDIGSGALEVDLHLPGLSDLSTLAGRDVHVVVNTEDGPFANQATLTIEDGTGLLFMASNVPGASAAIGWGEVVAEEDVEGAMWSYTAVVVNQDAAPTTLMPGDAANATIGGSSWRVVPLAAYRLEDDSDYELDCIIPPNVLAFEMLRVDEPAEPERIERPAELPMVQALSCE
jgi:hypothetical protein